MGYIGVLRIYKFFFIAPETKPIVPLIVSAFDIAIRKASSNFCAISSKKVVLWNSPTFLYYLTLNDVKNIQEYNLKHSEIKFSQEHSVKESFYNEGFELIDKIGNKEGIFEFFGLRLLIYPKEIYKNHEKEILALIQSHAIARVHCIPVIREELIKKLKHEEKTELKEFTDIIKQEVKEEQTDISRWDRFASKFSKKDDPYSISIPDFLIINNNPDKVPDEQIWWYEGNEANYTKKTRNVLKAKQCYRILCKKIKKDIIWSQYTDELFRSVSFGKVKDSIGKVKDSIIKVKDSIDFFSRDYFEKWLAEIRDGENPSYSLLKEWIEKEEDVIKEILLESNKKKEKTNINNALDVGCGWGRHIEIMIKNGVERAVGVDNNHNMIRRFGKLYKKYSEKVAVRYEDASDLSFENNIFELVICMTNTFGNIKGEQKRQEIIKEIARVLKPNGTFVLSVYNNSEKSAKLRKQSYLDVGLHPYGDDKIIKTKEGLISEQFTLNEIKEKYLNEHFKIIKEIPINECAFIVITQKS